MLKSREGQRVPDVRFRTRVGEQWKEVTTATASSRSGWGCSSTSDSSASVAIVAYFAR
jgi:hypothetical protein